MYYGNNKEQYLMDVFLTDASNHRPSWLKNVFACVFSRSLFYLCE